MSNNPFLENLKARLQERPDDCYVADTYIAVLIGEDVLVITGDFADATPEAINKKIVDTLNQITKR